MSTRGHQTFICKQATMESKFQASGCREGVQIYPLMVLACGSCNVAPQVIFVLVEDSHTRIFQRQAGSKLPPKLLSPATLNQI